MVWVVAAAVVAGCSSSTADPSPSATPAETEPAEEPTSTFDPSDPLAQTREILAEIEVKATGAVAFDWKGQEVLSIVRADGGEPSNNLLGIQMPWALAASNGVHRYRFAVDLLGVYHDQPVEYVIEPRKPDDAGPRSLAFLVYLRVTDRVKDDYQVYDEKDVLEHVQFNLVDQPCTIRLGARAVDGELRCAGLSDEAGRHVAFTATWRVVPGQDPAQ